MQEKSNIENRDSFGTFPDWAKIHQFKWHSNPASKHFSKTVFDKSFIRPQTDKAWKLLNDSKIDEQKIRRQAFKIIDKYSYDSAPMCLGRTVQTICDARLLPQDELNRIYQTKDRKVARPAVLEFVTCPSCKKQVTLPDLPPDRSTLDLFCPFCESKIDIDGQKSEGEPPHLASVKSDLEKADLTPTREANPSPKPPKNYMPLYVLFVLCLGACLFWAFETGHLPVEALPFDQWLKILQ